jgi:hypothetical protein
MSGAGLGFLLAGFLMVDCEDSRSVLARGVGSGAYMGLEKREGVVVEKELVDAGRKPGNDCTRLLSETRLRLL